MSLNERVFVCQVHFHPWLSFSCQLDSGSKSDQLSHTFLNLYTCKHLGVAMSYKALNFHCLLALCFTCTFIDLNLHCRLWLHFNIVIVKEAGKYMFDHCADEPIIVQLHSYRM